MPCGVAGMYDNYDAEAHSEIRSLREKVSKLEADTNSTQDVDEILKENARFNNLKTICDDLTYQNDVLREIVLEAYNSGKIELNDELAHKINVDQMNHRQEDLDRLEKVFLGSRDSEKLGKVWSADVQYPLEPQLGFDPNEF